MLCFCLGVYLFSHLKTFSVVFLNKTFSVGNAHSDTHAPNSSQGFTACVGVFYGRATFNYLPRSLPGLGGVDYHHTELPPPELHVHVNEINPPFSQRLWHFLPDDLGSADPLEAPLDRNMSRMNSDQLHSSTLRIYSVSNRECEWCVSACGSNETTK